MAIHKSLVLGRNARGSYGNFTASTWKGVGYIKEKANPSNPNTPAQSAQRTDFAAQVNLWHTLGYTQADKAAFNVLAGRQSKALTGFNMYMSTYRKAYGAGDAGQYFYGLAGAKVVNDLNITGFSDSNEVTEIYCYTTSFTFWHSQAGIPIALAIDETVLTANIPDTGYFQIQNNSAGFAGLSGYYYYDIS